MYHSNDDELARCTANASFDLRPSARLPLQLGLWLGGTPSGGEPYASRINAVRYVNLPAVSATATPACAISVTAPMTYGHITGTCGSFRIRDVLSDLAGVAAICVIASAPLFVGAVQ